MGVYDERSKKLGGHEGCERSSITYHPLPKLLLYALPELYCRLSLFGVSMVDMNKLLKVRRQLHPGLCVHDRNSPWHQFCSITIATKWCITQNYQWKIVITLPFKVYAYGRCKWGGINGNGESNNTRIPTVPCYIVSAMM